jgi:hypothetical protein
VIIEEDSIVGMHRACQKDFGALARMCTSKEFWTSPSVEIPPIAAWIQPSVVGTFTREVNGRVDSYAIDFWGKYYGLNYWDNDDRAPARLPTCYGWSSSSGDLRGIALMDHEIDGLALITHACSATNIITCCTPALQ